ncbi:MAG: EAL domain-containing protein (putative c-di-GMP-specific phosphodiesterase class I) [Cognaticolwellia sp.]
MPSDYLIINRSFIKGVAANDNDKVKVGTIISMAHNLNSYVTAEGIQTQEQLNFLEENA